MDIYSAISIVLLLIGLLLTYVRKWPLTQSLILLNLGVFLLTVMANWDRPSFLLSPVQIDLGFRPEYLTTGENIYTLFTQMFVHADILHILFNMLFLFLIGIPLEERIGGRRFALIYFIAGFAGVLMESVVQGLDSTTLIIGASAAISGAMGAMLLLYPRDEIPMFLGPIFLPRVPVWLSVGSWFAIQVVTVFTLHGGLASGTVAYSAHITGFFAGALVAQYSVPRISIGKKDDTISWQELATTDELRQTLARIENETVPDVRRAWMEHFARSVVCPICGGRPRLEGNRLKCTCGWEKGMR